MQPDSDTAICQGESLSLIVNKALTNIRWNDGSTAQERSLNQKGLYTLRALSTEKCPVQDSLNLSIIDPPPYSLLPPDSSSCTGLDVAVTLPDFPPYNTIAWSDADSAKTRTFNQSGTWKVTVQNRCFSIEDTLSLSFLDCTPFIPNLLTPNGDGKNDVLQILLKVPRRIETRIFNQWGEMIYANQDYRNNWMPQNLTDGIYFYLVNDPLLKKSYKGYLMVRSN